ncbi:hypothetical protein DRE_00107 [Drechslerella stenobrocha 248]|uniref:Uncharacterized protein n=1 Tax=Drechslerella stenobrocha 248 TaxID=1043628 RepID=W7I9N3_9PEZI|nr:hypothetical protein DRE_00107 [Drechslerella stenobrocha 248]
MASSNLAATSSPANAQQVSLGNIEDIKLASVTPKLRLEFEYDDTALVLRFTIPAKTFLTTAHIISSVLPDEIELARIALGVRESADGLTPVRGRRRGRRRDTAASAVSYALKVKKAVSAVDRRLVQVETPENMLVTGIRSVGQVRVFGDRVFQDEPVAFGELDKVQQAVAKQWSRFFWGLEPEDVKRGVGALPTAQTKDIRALWKANSIKPSSTDASQVNRWIVAQEVERFRLFIEQQPAYESAVNLLQRFRDVMTKKVPLGSRGLQNADSKIWFGIAGLIERRSPTKTRSRGLAAESTRPNVRRHLVPLAWEAEYSALETPTASAANRLAGFSLESPGTPSKQPDQSPSPLSIYADTDCCSPQTPSERAVYVARHARGAREWPQGAYDSWADSREPSPASSHANDENTIGVDEWPVMPGGHGSTSILTGHPGGLSLGLVRSEPDLKRRLTAASFRSSTPRRGVKKIKKFAPPMPYSPNFAQADVTMDDETEIEDLTDDDLEYMPDD